MVLLTCPLYISKPQYFLSLCRYIGHGKHNVFLFIALKQLLETVVYLRKTFAICCAAFLIQLHSLKGTKLFVYCVIFAAARSGKFLDKAVLATEIESALVML